MNILDFAKKKLNHEKICMVTCYDYTSALIAAKTSVDIFLVGDSTAMTMHGLKDTLRADIPMMCFHISAVSRGAGDKFIVGDLPFLSYRKSLSQNITAAQKLMQAGAHAVKLEGVKGNEKLIQHLTDSGVPVMGHIGLTPQSLYALGGYKVQGKTNEAAIKLMDEAHTLQMLGCFALVLECVPMQVAKEITESLSISTIGIGAGPYTNGQVLVFQDLLGLTQGFKPKFVKTFADGETCFRNGLEQFAQAVRQGKFPLKEHAYE